MRLKFNFRPRGALAAGAIATALCLGMASASAKTIIDEWASIKAPPAPALHDVTLNPKTTALLVLDLVKQTCNEKVRPRCLASLPKVHELIAHARAAKVLVIYSIIPGPATIADTLKEVAPLGTEPVVKSGPDKFIGTDLDKILKEHGITTVVTVGTAAHGAVLYTASHAALLGYRVVLPVDGMSAETPYAEQYVAWNMVHAPVVSMHVTLTSIDRLKF